MLTQAFVILFSISPTLTAASCARNNSKPFTKTLKGSKPHRTYITPDTALPFDSPFPLSESQVNQWKNHGYILLNNLIPHDLITRVVNETLTAYSSDNEILTDFGSDGKSEFPSQISSINELTLHSRILQSISQLLNTNDLLLTQGNVWRKKGVCRDGHEALENHDQRMHMDFPNHYWVHPTKWDNPEAVELIIYLSDSEITGGNTAVVERINNKDKLYEWPYKNMPGFGKLKWINDKNSAEKYVKNNDRKMYQFRKSLYKREKFVTFKPGTVLFYRFDLWHRGTELNEGEFRYVENIVYKKREATHINAWNRGFSTFMYEPNQFVEKLIAKLDVNQRNALGFPKPGDKYWNIDTLNAVESRYACFGMDMKPYWDVFNINNYNSKEL